MESGHHNDATVISEGSPADESAHDDATTVINEGSPANESAHDDATTVISKGMFRTLPPRHQDLQLHQPGATPRLQMQVPPPSNALNQQAAQSPEPDAESTTTKPVAYKLKDPVNEICNENC